MNSGNKFSSSCQNLLYSTLIVVALAFDYANKQSNPGREESGGRCERELLIGSYLL